MISLPSPHVHSPPLDSFHMRKGPDEPTEFGYFLLRKMAEHDPPLSQAELARRMGVGQSTISRWIFAPGRPQDDKLRLLAAAIDVKLNDLLAMAGYGEPSGDVANALSNLRLDVDPLAEELSAMLDDSSPLSATDRAFLRHTVDRLMDPYRKSMRRRRNS